MKKYVTQILGWLLNYCSLFLSTLPTFNINGTCVYNCAAKLAFKSTAFSKFSKNYLLSIGLLLLVLLSSCEQKPSPLEGKWQRYDDPSTGSVIRVERIGDNFQGKLIKVSGELADLNFEENEVKWKKITEKEPHHYEGLDLLKAVTKTGAVAYTRYEEVYFTLENDDILLVSSIVKGAESNNSQKWKKLKW